MLSLLAGCGDGPEQEQGAPQAAAGAPEPTPPAATLAGPALSFEREVEPLGQIFDAVEYTVRFPFVNSGETDLVIGEVKVTCGCTTTQLERLRFAPGEGSEIAVTYKPAGRGPVRRTVSVHSNDPARPAIDLHIDSDVRPFVEFEPDQVLLGELDRGQEHRTKVRFRCADPGAVVLEVSSMHPQLEVTQLGEDEQGWQRLELRLAPDAPWGSFIGRVSVRVRGVAVAGAEPIAYFGRLLIQAMLFDELRADPHYLSVGMIQPGVPFRAHSEIWHRGGKPFELTSLRFEEANPSTMTARTEPLEGARVGYRVILEGQVDAPGGGITGVLVVESDVEGEEPFRLSIMGRVSGEPGLPNPGAPPH